MDKEDRLIIVSNKIKDITNQLKNMSGQEANYSELWDRRVSLKNEESEIEKDLLNK